MNPSLPTTIGGSTEAEKIAARLTPAQRGALKRAKGGFVPRSGGLPHIITGLVENGLLLRRAPGQDQNACLTPLGLAVRAVLTGPIPEAVVTQADREAAAELLRCHVGHLISLDCVRDAEDGHGAFPPALARHRADATRELLEALEYLVSLGGGDCLDPARAAIANARGGEVAADDDRPICVGCGQRFEWSDERWTSDDDGVTGCPACFTEDGCGLCWNAQAAISKARGQ